MIDWNHPEKTKEAVVREAVPGCTYKFEGDRGRFILREARGERRGEIIAAGMSISEMWDAAYALTEIAAYVAAHRTQEALDENESCARGWHEACTRMQCPCECHKKVAPECQCGSGICPVLFGFPRPTGKRCKQSGTQEAPAEAQGQPKIEGCVDCRDFEANIRGWIEQLGGDTDTPYASLELERLIDAIATQKTPLPLPEPTQTTHSAAERERAAEQICITGEAEGAAFFARHPDIGYKIALETQMALNAANAKIAELEKLLAAHKGISEGKSDVVKQLEARNAS